MKKQNLLQRRLTSWCLAVSVCFSLIPVLCLTASASGRYEVENTRNATGYDIVNEAKKWATEGATYWSYYEPWRESIYWRTGYLCNGQKSFDCSGFVSRVLNDVGFRGASYAPYGGSGYVLSDNYGSRFIGISIEELVNYGRDISDAVQRAKGGDYSQLQAGDIIGWTSGALGRHIIIYAGLDDNGRPTTVEFTGSGYSEGEISQAYQDCFQFGARYTEQAGVSASVSSSDSLSLFGANYPSSLAVGNIFILYGTVRSGRSAIKSLTVGVYDENGNEKTGRTVYPNTSSYDINKVDADIRFDWLKDGVYYYRITASNSSETVQLLNQKFTVGNATLSSSAPTPTPAAIAEGYYALTPACAPSMRLDISGGSTENGGNAQIWSVNDSDAQTFRFTSTDSGYYTIAAKCSGLVLDVFQGASSSGTNVAQYNYGGGTNQQWMLNDAGNGYYEIIPRMSNSICLDVSGADSAEGTNVQIWERNQTDAQKWKLTPVSIQENPAKNAVAVDLPKQTVYVQGQFSDVPANQWYTNNVAETFELGLMKGNSSTTFNPYGDVTIAEAITMASRIHSVYTNGSENIRKTSSGEAWYQPYLDYAYSNGLIRVAYYNCDVRQKANRAQFAEIFANALPDEALSAINSVPDDAIPDVKATESYAVYVYKLYRAGILGGSDANGTFHPTTYITRAEAATIVARMGVSANRISISIG